MQRIGCQENSQKKTRAARGLPHDSGEKRPSPNALKKRALAFGVEPIGEFRLELLDARGEPRDGLILGFRFLGPDREFIGDVPNDADAAGNRTFALADLRHNAPFHEFTYARLHVSRLRVGKAPFMEFVLGERPPLINGVVHLELEPPKQPLLLDGVIRLDARLADHLESVPVPVNQKLHPVWPVHVTVIVWPETVPTAVPWHVGDSSKA